MWQVQLLGGFSVRPADSGGGGNNTHGSETLAFRTAKSRLLLAYLALNPDRPHERRWLAGRFWPDVDAARQRANLAREVHGLRHLLEQGRQITVIEGTYNAILFRSRAVTVDATEFDRLSAPGTGRSTSKTERIAALEKALDLYRGPFLQGYDDISGDYSLAWIETERYRLEERHANVLSELAGLHEARGELRQAMDYALRVSETDLLTEERRERLLRLLMRSPRGTRMAQLILPEEMDSAAHLRTALLHAEALLGQEQAKTRDEERLIDNLVRDTMALLAEDERALLVRLVVFPGGCTSEMARLVCRCPNAGVLLERIAARHLVTRSIDSDGNARYRLPEAIVPLLETSLTLPGRKALAKRLAVWIFGRKRAYLARLRSEARENETVKPGFMFSFTYKPADPGPGLPDSLGPDYANLTSVQESFLNDWRDDTVLLRTAARLAIHTHEAMTYHNAREEDRLRFAGWLLSLLPRAQSLCPRLKIDLGYRALNTAWYLTLNSALGQQLCREALALLQPGAFENGASPALDDLLLNLSRAAIANSAEKTASERHVLIERIANLAGNAHRSERDQLANDLFKIVLQELPGCEDVRLATDALATYGDSLWVQGRLPESRACFEQALRLATDAGDKECLMNVQGWFGPLLMVLGECAEAERLLDEALDYSMECGDLAWIEGHLRSLGMVCLAQGNLGKAQMSFRESIKINEVRNDRASAADGLRGLGLVAFQRGDLILAKERLQEAKSFWAEMNHQRWLATISLHLALVAFHAGDDSESLRLCTEAEAHIAQTTAPASIATAACVRGWLALRAGQTSEALDLQRRALALRARIGNQKTIIESLEAVAFPLHAAAETAKAAVLLMSAATARAIYEMPVPPVEKPVMDALRKAVSVHASARETTLPIEEAVALALSTA